MPKETEWKKLVRISHGPKATRLISVPKSVLQRVFPDGFDCDIYGRFIFDPEGRLILELRRSITKPVSEADASQISQQFQAPTASTSSTSAAMETSSPPNSGAGENVSEEGTRAE
jgi:hypothetical protein